MLKPIKECKGLKPKFIVSIKKEWNLWCGYVNRFLVFKDWDKERLKNDLDKYCKSIDDISKIWWDRKIEDEELF